MNTNSSNIITQKMAVWMGFSGILGSLVLFAGDMLFYYNGEQSDFIANMAYSSSERIILSGTSALIAAWLYTFASGQVYYGFQPTKKWIRMTVFISFAAIMISYGVIHGAYVAIATSAKNAIEVGISPNSFTELAIATNNMLRYVTYLPFAIFTILFIPTVWMKKTYYPRWVLLFSPIILFLLNGVVTENIAGRMKIIIGGGYLNLILLIFFTTSTIALWFDNQEPEMILSRTIRIGGRT